MKIRNLMLVFFAFYLGIAGCQSKKVLLTPEGYDLQHPDKTDLGTKLQEISGIFWVNDSLMLANNDESGKIFNLNPSNKKDFTYPTVEFGEKDDYEDIVKVDSSVYLLISTGKIIEVKAQGDSAHGTVVAELPGKDNEFESMYYDKDIHSLIMLCKKCNREKDQFRSAYKFDLRTYVLSDTPYYKIDINLLKQIAEDNRQEFQPSAAAINPALNKLFIVSSIGKLLVITDKKGTVQYTFPLSPTMFPQPEGITFSKDGDMFISNEAMDDRATLLKFSYRPVQ